MSALRSAIENTSEAEVLKMVNQYIGSLLFKIVAAPVETKEQQSEARVMVNQVRQHSLVYGLPDKDRLEVLKLCDDAERLIEME